MQDPGLRLDIPLVDTEEFSRILTITRQDSVLTLDVKLVDTEEFARIQKKEQARPRAEA